jgi:hypothetical protein
MMTRNWQSIFGCKNEHLHNANDAKKRNCKEQCAHHFNKRLFNDLFRGRFKTRCECLPPLLVYRQLLLLLLLVLVARLLTQLFACPQQLPHPQLPLLLPAVRKNNQPKANSMLDGTPWMTTMTLMQTPRGRVEAH